MQETYSAKLGLFLRKNLPLGRVGFAKVFEFNQSNYC